jgi:hypothetical protein
MLTRLDTREVVLPMLVDVVDDRLMQCLLVPFQRQHIVRLALDDLPRDRLLGPHGIDRDDGALDVHQPQQFGDGRDLIRFLGAGDLPQRQAELAGPDADRMQGAQAVLAVVAPPGRLAVDRQDRSLDAGRLGRHRPQRSKPVREAGLKHAGLERHEDATEDVLSRDAVGQVQHRDEELLFERGPLGDRGRAVRAGQDRHQGDDDHARQGMLPIDGGAWVFQLLEMPNDLDDADPVDVRHDWPAVRRAR